MKKKFLSFIFIIYVIIAIFVTICLLSYNRFKITEFGDKSLLIISDDQMAPNFKKGDLVIADKKSKSTTDYENISLKQSVLIGISQAIAAAFTGVSRSGITMTVARALKIDRESAAKFSFMLAMPITLAAVIFDLTKFTFTLPLLLGILASFITGVIVIKFLLDYLKKGSFKVFAIYRVIFGAIILAIYFIR